jgi:hypothetical protein
MGKHGRNPRKPREVKLRRIVIPEGRADEHPLGYATRLVVVLERGVRDDAEFLRRRTLEALEAALAAPDPDDPFVVPRLVRTGHGLRTSAAFSTEGIFRIVLARCGPGPGALGLSATARAVVERALEIELTGRGGYVTWPEGVSILGPAGGARPVAAEALFGAFPVELDAPPEHPFLRPDELPGLLAEDGYPRRAQDGRPPGTLPH